MRVKTLRWPLQTRVSKPVLLAIQAEAHRRGLTVAELLRRELDSLAARYGFVVQDDRNQLTLPEF